MRYAYVLHRVLIGHVIIYLVVSIHDAPLYHTCCKTLDYILKLVENEPTI
jgi:hypothetical protein